MEDSSIKAGVYYKFELSEKDINTLDDVDQPDANYGDVFKCSDSRDCYSFFLGKNGSMVKNPDYTNSGYLSIPYEITQHLQDAVSKYEDVDYFHIDLRYDDNFIRSKLGVVSEEFQFKFRWDRNQRLLIVIFPNKVSHGFDVSKETLEDVLAFYEGSKKEQATVNVCWSLSGNAYARYMQKNQISLTRMVTPSKPATWSTFTRRSSGGMGSRSTLDVYTGPLDEMPGMVQVLQDFYRGYEYTITANGEVIECPGVDDSPPEEPYVDPMTAYFQNFLVPGVGALPNIHSVLVPKSTAVEVSNLAPVLDSNTKKLKAADIQRPEPAVCVAVTVPEAVPEAVPEESSK